MSELRKAAERALKALEDAQRHMYALRALDALEGAQRHMYALRHREIDALVIALRAALQREALNEVHQSDHEGAHVTAAVAAAVNAEREACAKVAEVMLRHYTQAVTGVPEAIRARGET